MTTFKIRQAKRVDRGSPTSDTALLRTGEEICSLRQFGWAAEKPDRAGDLDDADRASDPDQSGVFLHGPLRRVDGSGSGGTPQEVAFLLQRSSKS